MKKLLFIYALSTICYACKKYTGPDSINAPFVSSDHTVQVKFDFSMPVDFTIFVPCTNEQVHFTGELVSRYHIAETGDGPRFHFHGNSQSHYQDMRGVGITSGKRYTFISRRIDVANYRNSESEPFVGRISEASRVTTPGGDNFTMVIVVRLVRNGSGEVIISSQEEKVYCQ
jgi:hypothetical protein